MFEWLVHSGTRQKMLKMFFRDVEKPLYGLEISQTLNASPGTTHRELNAMLAQDILKKKKEGALVMYSLNTQHPYFFELKKAIFPPKKKAPRVLMMSDLHLSVDTPQDLIDDFHLFLDYAEETSTELVFLGDMVEMLKGNAFHTYLVHKGIFDRISVLSHHMEVTYVVGNHDCFLKLLCGTGESARLFDSKINFTEEYWNKRFNIYATHGNRFDDYSELKGFKAPAGVEYPGKEIQKALKKSSGSELLVQAAEYANAAVDMVEYGRKKDLKMGERLEAAAANLIHEEDFSYVVMGHSHQAGFKQINHGIYFNSGSWSSEKKRHFIEIDKDGGALVEMSELK